MRSADSSSPDLPNPDDVLDIHVGVSPEESGQAIDAAFEQLFFGDPDTQAFYHPEGDDAAYILNVKAGDVRTDSIGYGMLVTVELDKQEIFDKLWTWAKRTMLMTKPPREGMLAWQCTPSGEDCADSAATDATTIIATSLFMAEAKWNDTGAHDYQSDANMLIDAMVQTEERNGGVVNNVQNLFDVKAALPRKTSSAGEDRYLKVDYLMPAFYEYWASWRPTDASFWLEAADNSRQVMQAAVLEGTGLIPAQVSADGAPAPTIDYYDELTARTLLNRWLDYSWFGKRTWISEANGVLLDFFLERKAESEYVSAYHLDGTKLGSKNTTAHAAMVATAAAASDRPEEHDVFLQDLIDKPIPEGEDRYYQGMLYLVGWLAVSGRLQAVSP